MAIFSKTIGNFSTKFYMLITPFYLSLTTNFYSIICNFDEVTPSTPLASGASTNHLQVGYDHLQVPSWSGAVLLG